MKKIVLLLIYLCSFSISFSQNKDFQNYVNTLIDNLKSSNLNTTYESIFSEKNNSIKEKNEYYSAKNGISYVKVNNSVKIRGYFGDQEYSLPEVLRYFSTTETFQKYLTSNNKDKYFIELYDYFYNGVTPSDFIGKAPSEEPESIQSTMYPGNGMSRSGTFNYSYIKELGVFLVQDNKKFCVFDAIYGPLLFQKDPSGFKLVSNQQPVLLNAIKGTLHKSPLRNNPYNFEYYVSNFKGSYPNEGYNMRILDNTHIEPVDLPRYTYSDITEYKNVKYFIAENFYVIEGEKEYRYYPSYQEKVAIYGTGSLPISDLKNPNFYILKKESDRKIYEYGILSACGYCIIPMIYDEIKPINNNCFITKKDSKYGLLLLTSERLRSKRFVIYNNVFDEIVDNMDGTLSIKINDESKVIDFFGNELIDKKSNRSADLIGNVSDNIKDSETVTDIDGNIYHTVTIGTQVWIVENLKTTKYRNGDPIPNIPDPKEWSSSITGAYCSLPTKIPNATKYGLLYNWHVVNDSRNIAPIGWHIPNNDDWTTLITFLGGVEVVSEKLIGTEKTFWQKEGSNSSGFNALAGGQIMLEKFFSINQAGFWWSSSEYDKTNAKYFMLGSIPSSVFGESNFRSKTDGASIRCIKGELLKTNSSVNESEIVVSKSDQNEKVSKESNRDPQPRKDYANVFYKPQYTLFDLLTDEPIFPDKNGIYTIYYATNENKIPTKLVCSGEQLSRKTVYKFKNLENCQKWCK